METFVPLYISNKCDSYCTMCNFSRNNKSLHRVEATFDEITEQLKIILEYEKISAVCILTGEMYSSKDRMHNIELVCRTMNKAFEIGFVRVFFNIGSLFDEEIEYISSHISNKKDIVLSLFQETYDRDEYRKYFGKYPDCNAKADYQNRLDTIDRWLNHGFSNIDIGILLGFKPIGRDVDALIDHAKKYISHGANVYLSTPRVKNGIVNEEAYRLILARIHECIPSAKLVITTRETMDFINSVINLVSVVSPGSSDICPYNRGIYILNKRETSQFVINTRRMRPFDVLSGLVYQGRIEYFDG